MIHVLADVYGIRYFYMVGKLVCETFRFTIIECEYFLFKENIFFVDLFGVFIEKVLRIFKVGIYN